MNNDAFLSNDAADVLKSKVINAIIDLTTKPTESLADTNALTIELDIPYSDKMTPVDTDSVDDITKTFIKLFGQTLKEWLTPVNYGYKDIVVAKENDYILSRCHFDEANKRFTRLQFVHYN